eukprot:COSAG01_NODE_762_length_13792_cov_19.126707_4_plen_75_part_00
MTRTTRRLRWTAKRLTDASSRPTLLVRGHRVTSEAVVATEAVAAAPGVAVDMVRRVLHFAALSRPTAGHLIDWR